MKFLISFSIACASIMASSTASAQQPAAGAEVLNDVTGCRSIADDAQRLACYDASVARLSSAAERRDIVVVDRQQIRETRRTLFGLPLPRLRLFGGSDDEPEVEEVREIESTIRQASAFGHRLWTLQLADGSTWQTTEIMQTGDPEPGSPVRIRRAGLGSYFANVNGARAVRVRRIQ